MSVNRERPHLLVLPEDRANEEIVNGFSSNLSLCSRAIQVERPSGGWLKVVDNFKDNHAAEMRKFPKRMIVLLIDFDDMKPEQLSYEDRLNYIKNQIAEDLKERVFILGSRTSPERLRSNMKKSFEEIGESLARDCADHKNETWGHELLKHNEKELKRMILSVKPFLFTDY